MTGVPGAWLFTPLFALLILSNLCRSPYLQYKESKNVLLCLKVRNSNVRCNIKRGKLRAGIFLHVLIFV